MNWQTKLLTIAYFIAEVAINYSLYGQLAVKSNFFTVQSLEMWGKIITGIGAALLIVQTSTILRKSLKRTAIIQFFCLCIFTIPLSFYVQNMIIESIVDKADEKQLNNAILLTAVKSTLVPYYNYSHANYEVSMAVRDYDKITFPFRSKVDITGYPYMENEKHFFALSDKCSQVSEKGFGLEEDIDKALFSIKSLRSPNALDEAAYKGLIKDFYICLYEDEKYSAAHIREVNPNTIEAREKINLKYREYRDKSGDYSDGIRKANRLGGSRALQSVERAWRQGVNRQLGFQTTIKPNLSYEEFVEHPDVKRAFFREAGKDVIYPFGAEWDEYLRKKVISEVVEALPDAALVGYVNQDGSVIEPEKDDTPEFIMIEGVKHAVATPGVDPDYLKHGFPTEKDKGEEAYKAIVVPIIGLGLSAFFLVFNLILTGASWLSSYSKIMGFAFGVIGLAWALIWPNYSLSQAAQSEAVAESQAGTDVGQPDGVSEVMSDGQFDYESFLLNALYYHEKNLGKLYKNFL
ncbi:MAG: hypothetical protein VYA60_10650 [Pseudomonadota bacterium]|nr:hypothetical protein [Pseudomonadota bacterium]